MERIKISQLKCGKKINKKPPKIMQRKMEYEEHSSHETCTNSFEKLRSRETATARRCDAQ